MKSKLQCGSIPIPFVTIFCRQELYTNQDMPENQEEEENAHMFGNEKTRQKQMEKGKRR